MNMTMTRDSLLHPGPGGPASGRMPAPAGARTAGGGGEAAADGDNIYLRRIDRGGTHWISRPAGRRIVCDSGRLLLCLDGEELQVTLERGESHLCTSKARLSVFALQPGSFHVV